MGHIFNPSDFQFTKNIAKHCLVLEMLILVFVLLKGYPHFEKSKIMKWVKIQNMIENVFH